MGRSSARVIMGGGDVNGLNGLQENIYIIL